MSSIFHTDTLFFQRLMAGCGLYSGELDDDWGPLTEGAFAAFTKLTKAISETYGKFDRRTESNIATMLPKAQRAARIFLTHAQRFNYQVKILSGTRTYAEQTKLYEQGRVTPGPRVTNAQAGQSNHNFGIAWDVGIFDGKIYLTGATPEQVKVYDDLRKFTKPFTPSIAWGGDWRTIKDRPHYELRTKKSTAQIRALLEQGKPYV